MIERAHLERLLADQRMISPYLSKPIAEFEPGEVLIYVELLRRCTTETHEEQIARLEEHLALRAIVEAMAAKERAAHGSGWNARFCVFCYQKLGKSHTETCIYRRARELIGAHE